MENLVKPTFDELASASLDVSEPEEVHIGIRSDGKVVWVNVDGICLLRICKIPKDGLLIEDSRQGEETE